MRQQYLTMGSFVEPVKNSYRCPRLDGQEYCLEVLVEKDALAGILEQVTDKYHVLLLANKGYLSTSAMHDVALRMDTRKQDRQCVILYMGDRDPRGMDMMRDIRDRLLGFGCCARVERIALTMNRVDQHGLPSNPAKRIDPRSRRYSDEYGGRSWELDALNPEILIGILKEYILRYLDVRKYEKAIRREQREKDDLERDIAGMRRS